MPRTPSFRLDGKRAIVTRAGRGIGVAEAVAFAGAGADVTLLARSAGEIEASAVAIGNGALAAMLDVSDLDAVDVFFSTRDSFDVLVSNAGSNRPKPMWDVFPADYDAALDLNVESAFFVAQMNKRYPVPHGWDHVMWVSGFADRDAFLEYADQITHRENDLQIPAYNDHMAYDQAVNSSKLTLRMFPKADFEVEHCDADNGTSMRDYIADRCAQIFVENGLTA